MKIWYNRINESRRTLIESELPEIMIGRDPSNTVVLASPLVSRRHAKVWKDGPQLVLENLGLNSCVVGDEEVLGRQRAEFGPGTAVRIWPYTITFQSEETVKVSQNELEAHLRSLVADLETEIHQRLLDRLDLYDFDPSQAKDEETILLLERNIEDVCRELNLFSDRNKALLEEIAGLTIRDYLVNRLIVDGATDEFFDLASIATNQFDVPATLVPEREEELHGLLQFARERLGLEQCRDSSEAIRRIESRLSEVFHLMRPHLHDELQKYLILRLLNKDLKDTVFGFGPLQDLLRAPTVTEIMVIAHDKIYVERDGVIERTGRRFISDEVTESIIERIVGRMGRRIDKSQPLVDARLPDGSRVNAIIPPLAVQGPCLTIRKFPLQRLVMDDLIETGSIAPAAAAFLRAAVVDRRNLMVSGGTGTGKTTLLNVLSAFVPFKERIVTVEDTVELRLHQEHVVTLETRPPNAEGVGEFTIRDLVRNALRMRPDRIIVGECRGGEALDMLQAMNTGHDGSMTSIHANSPSEVIERLEVLVLMAADLPIVSIHRQIASAIDLIIHINRLPTGERIVSAISEIAGVDPETSDLIVLDIFNYRDGRALRPTGYLPSFVGALVEKGLLDVEFLFGRKSDSPSAISAPPPVPPLARRDL